MWIRLGNSGIDSKHVVSVKCETHKTLGYYFITIKTNIKTLFGYETKYFEIDLKDYKSINEMHDSLKIYFSDN